ncbi:MAG TPA: DUF3248 domain-containing protein [Deinococcales bacterium]|nr:DUF3248 domain-containing protein [Deinococcales bacterium]
MTSDREPDLDEDNGWLEDPDGAGEDEEDTVDAAVLEGLGNQLVWKIGKEEGSERVIVRVGYASATRSFADLPRLRGATDAEVADAARKSELIVEWID